MTEQRPDPSEQPRRLVPNKARATLARQRQRDARRPRTAFNVVGYALVGAVLGPFLSYLGGLETKGSLGIEITGDATFVTALVATLIGMLFVDVIAKDGKHAQGVGFHLAVGVAAFTLALVVRAAGLLPTGPLTTDISSLVNIVPVGVFYFVSFVVVTRLREPTRST